MITIREASTLPEQQISEEARCAIALGVRRGDPVAELEYLGLSVRTMNILENSEFQITKLEQLVTRSREELLNIPNVTTGVVVEILGSLSKYHLLDDKKRLIDSPENFLGAVFGLDEL